MASPPKHSRLKTNSIGWAGQFFQSMAHMAPAVGIIMAAPYMASRAGNAIPLATLFGMILALLLAYCLGLLTRKYYGASGYFQIHSRALGKRIGFTTSWLFLLYEPFNVFATWLGFGAVILEPFSQAYLGYKIPWWMGLIIGNVLITLLSLVNLKASMRTTAALGIIEFIIFLVLSAVLLEHSHRDFQPSLFLPSASSDGYGGLLFAFVFSFLCFVGYESGLPLTEETKDAKKSTFKGLITSVLIAGGFFTFVSYATVVGFGEGQSSADFAKSFSTTENPYGQILALKAFGKLGPWIVFFAALNSTLACTLASQNSATRVLFALGRAGILYKKLGVTTKSSGVPHYSILFMALLTFTLTGLFYFIIHDNAGDWYGFWGVMLVLPLLIIHLMTCIGVYVTYRREKKEFRVFQHVFIPSVTGLLVLLPIWGSIYYNMTPPYSYAPWIVLGWFIIGIVSYMALQKYRSENLEALEQEVAQLAQEP